MKHSNRYSPELRERAVRLVLDHQGEHESQWAAIGSVSSKVGCSAETLHKRVRRAECDKGVRPGLTSAERERLKTLERENRELRRANEILRKASAYVAQAELGRGQSRRLFHDLARVPLAGCDYLDRGQGDATTPTSAPVERAYASRSQKVT